MIWLERATQNHVARSTSHRGSLLLRAMILRHAESIVGGKDGVENTRLKKKKPRP